jgi:hypothetical protein
VRGPGRVGAGDQPHAVRDQTGQLPDRGLEHVDVIDRGVAAGVARPQHRRERLTGAITTVQPCSQRMEPEPAFVGGRGAVLVVRVRGDQRRVEVDTQRLDDRFAALGRGDDRRRRTRPPRPRPCLTAGGVEAFDDQLVVAERHDRAVGRRSRRDITEQLGLAVQHRHVAQRVAAVGQRHDQVAHDLARIMPHPRPAPTHRPRQPCGQPDPVGGLRQQRGARPAGHAVSVRGDVEPTARLATLHPQGGPPASQMCFSTTHILAGQEGFPT